MNRRTRRLAAQRATFARQCEDRPAGDPRRDAVVIVVEISGRRDLYARHELAEPFLRRAVTP